MDILPPKKRSSISVPKAVEPTTVATEPASHALPSEEQSPSPSPNKRRSLFNYGIIAIVVLVLVAIAGLFIWYFGGLNPVNSHDSSRKRVEIASGTNVEQIATTLKTAGVIRDETIFRLYTELTHTKDHLQAGVYLFSPSQSLQTIVDALVAGKTDAFSVTIPPGLRLDQLKRILLSAGFKSDAIDAAYAATYSEPLFATKPASSSLEGFIFPDTYQVDGTTTVMSLLDRSFKEFDKKITDAQLIPKLQAEGLSLYQGITLASIIEREVTSPSDQKQVAQVFLLRLKMGMPLGSDVTYLYGAYLLGVGPSPTLDSPYNTRIVTGLPPGPIANFNFAALQAVTSPAAGDYLYFVAGDDGTTHFANTLDEHDQNVKNYCHKLCS